MKRRKDYFLYRIIRWLVWLFYPKMQVQGEENLPEGEAVIVANHCQMNGPICSELYCPGKHYTWCAGQMMKLKEVPQYAYRDFWQGKPKAVRWFYKLLSYVIAPISVCIFNNVNTVAVYHDSRVISTFKATVKHLEEGARVVILPETDAPGNGILTPFQDKFIDVARLYYKRTGKCLSFVPMYIAPNLKKMYFGKPVTFSPDAPMEAERSRICAYLHGQITAIARALPEHKVVPYLNVSRKCYPSNKEENT